MCSRRCFRVLTRIADRFANVGRSREVQNRADLIAAKGIAHEGRIPDAAFYQNMVLNGVAVTVRKVVQYNWLVLCARQSFDGVAADIAGPACHQYAHRRNYALAFCSSSTIAGTTWNRSPTIP